jgi:NAD(P)H-dependent FMN reductase
MGRAHGSANQPAFVGVSVGATGTALAQQHLRNILAYLDVPTLVQPEAFIQAKEGSFDADGNIGAASHPFLQELDELVRRLGEATCLMRRRCAVAVLRETGPPAESSQ